MIKTTLKNTVYALAAVTALAVASCKDTNPGDAGNDMNMTTDSISDNDAEVELQVDPSGTGGSGIETTNADQTTRDDGNERDTELDGE